MQKRELGIQIHEEWKGMTQHVGLVMEPIVLDRLGIFPETDVRVISNFQRRLEYLFEDQEKDNEIFSAIVNFKDFCKEVLNWQDCDLLKPEEFSNENNSKEISVVLKDYEEILKPDWIVPEIKKNNEKNIQIIVKELKIGESFDQIDKNFNNKKYWEATPHQRLERLLKDTENPIGILWNGTSLRLVYAPRGESSGHITFPLEPMITVDGRPMVGALEMILGPDRLFEGGSSTLRLKNIMELSRKEQNEVSTRLSEQVLEALWILVRGFDDAEKKANSLGKKLLKDLPEKEPSHIYGGLITILLRLVFLLYSEDEELMPKDTIYVQNYSVSGLASKLRQDRIIFQNSMEDRYGAWNSILSLFRLVFDGGGPYESYLPARHGELFDPDTYPFLEGRNKKSTSDNFDLSFPLISDDVIEKVLSKLLIIDGHLLSYRALDVEQIGSVYEAIMGFTIEKTSYISIGINYRPTGQKIPITLIIDACEFLDREGIKREKWLKNLTGIDFRFSPGIKKKLKVAKTVEELCIALENRLSPHTARGLDPGSLILQPTSERRRSGSHYTPRTLTEPVVAESFRPWLEDCDHKPSANQILSLKVCDPAMGSGAFLVASCRFLANLLVSAWVREGFPPEFNETFDKDIYARRLISQRCLYGVDKNQFAVSLAKLSLWLITLSRELPFTFVDHALKSGDSLVGYSLKDIENIDKEIQLNFKSERDQIFSKLIIEREEEFYFDNSYDSAYDRKRNLLDKQFVATENLREKGDLLVAAFFDGKNHLERTNKKQIYLSMRNILGNDEGSIKIVKQIRENLLFGDKGIKPFHWDLEFPEVFQRENRGFDVFVGNPPFAGNNTLVKSYPDGIIDWLKQLHPESHGNADLVAQFFRRCFHLLRTGGSLGLIATNTISQGDTRSTGLRWICSNGGTIYSAIKRYQWPGVAAVLLSIIHITKRTFYGIKKLNNKSVGKITAFLLPNGGNENPKPLMINKKRYFLGTIILGMGFTFEDSPLADNETPGTPSPISSMHKLISEDANNQQVIYPYIGGSEVSSSPTHAHKRYVVNFGDRSEEECREKWPELMNILSKKVKPLRQEQKRKVRRDNWWQYAEKQNALYQSINGFDKVLVNLFTSSFPNFTIIDSNYVFANSLNVFNLPPDLGFPILQSSIHEIWILFMSSSLKDDIRYTGTDCFETFPLPFEIEKYLQSGSDLINSNHIINSLIKVGKTFFEFRSKFMIKNCEGLTSTSNRFHDPEETNPDIFKLRDLFKVMDKIVLSAYGWEINFGNYGFNLDYLDVDENYKLPEELERRIKNKDLFFRDSGEAKSFQYEFNQLTGNKKKLRWRYRWPDQFRESILAKLIELNEICFNDECLKEKNKISEDLSENLNSQKIALPGKKGVSNRIRFVNL